MSIPASPPPREATTPIASIDPATFGDPGALDVGECRAPSTLTSATTVALRVLADLNATFGVATIRFSFNGTPAVVTHGNTVDQVHRDWFERRTAYQRAAGISG